MLYLLCCSGYAQTKEDSLSISCLSGQVYDPNEGLKLDEPATFPGGIERFYDFIDMNLRYPTAAKRLSVEGTVLVEFEVLSDGSINDSSICVIKGVGFEDLAKEAIRLVSIAPRWTPASYKGQPVASKMLVPIQFEW